MRELYLARHGESEYSRRGALNGDPSVPVPLTEAGREQARALAESLREIPLDLCVTSPFPRVIETAELALAGRDVARVVRDDLGDIRVGHFEGKQVEEFRTWIQEQGPTAAPAGGGETRVGAIERFCRAFRWIQGRGEETILVVTHGLPVTILPMAARGEPPPLTLEGTPTISATAIPMAAAELDRALTTLEAWARATAAA